jgi:hypothetical protein
MQIVINLILIFNYISKMHGEIKQNQITRSKGFQGFFYGQGVSSRVAGSPIKRLLATAKTSSMYENEYFQPYLPVADIVTIAAISCSF